MASTSIVMLVSLSTWRIMHTNVRSLRLKFPSLLLHKGYDMWSYLIFSFLFFSLTWSCWYNNLWPCRLFYKGKHYLNLSMIVDEKYWGEDVVLIDTLEANNAKIITWINNSVEHSIGTQLAKYEIINEVCDHLQRLFTQSNFAKQY